MTAFALAADISMTVWQLEKVFSENNMKVLERRFHDAPFLPTRSSG
jgi:hypothetical protein